MALIDINLKAVAVIEYALEHAAETLGLDPLQLRMDNFVSEGESEEVLGPNPLPAMIDQLKASADYDTRVADVDQFNAVSANGLLDFEKYIQHTILYSRLRILKMDLKLIQEKKSQIL